MLQSWVGDRICFQFILAKMKLSWADEYLRELILFHELKYWSWNMQMGKFSLTPAAWSSSIRCDLGQSRSAFSSDMSYVSGRTVSRTVKLRSISSIIHKYSFIIIKTDSACEPSLTLCHFVSDIWLVFFFFYLHIYEGIQGQVDLPCHLLNVAWIQLYILFNGVTQGITVGRTRCVWSWPASQKVGAEQQNAHQEPSSVSMRDLTASILMMGT